MDITLRNEEILKIAKRGCTLQEIVDVYGTTTSNISTLLNRLGYRKCEIIVQANNTLLVNQEIITRAKQLFENKIKSRASHSTKKILTYLDFSIAEACNEYKAKHN
jgi:transcriptional regulator